MNKQNNLKIGSGLFILQMVLGYVVWGILGDYVRAFSHSDPKNYSLVMTLIASILIIISLVAIYFGGKSLKQKESILGSVVLILASLFTGFFLLWGISLQFSL